jgi:hypothetical protein
VLRSIITRTPLESIFADGLEPGALAWVNFGSAVEFAERLQDK